ncbi:hypothetical protein V1638_01315 [Pseudarthrobacter sp. J64]|uniref:hypothetical protein n=1 Tax=Pseudarthrobacter sp. J64 TaxID=3116485 RepID=UPI002E811BE4|nr:hypothetical protein [Pseudarthrobacter sp. J64]MEE2568036.1 hypothetical protein [Pseudarthrobacter sp. J64]
MPPLAFLGPLFLGVVVYVILRWVIIAPGGKATPESISQHALWIGIMGWMGSSLHGAAQAGVLHGRPGGSNALETAGAILAALAWPVLAVLAIHAVGQFTYPRPRGVRRVAPLSVRRISDFLPRRLAWTTLAVFVAAALAICWVATLPGYQAVPPTNLPPPLPGQSFDSSYQTAGRDGRIAGQLLAVCLGAALAVLATGTWAVLALIAGRRQLETLDSADNDLLRTIAMNRLLRTVATVAAGLAAIAGNFAGVPDPALPPPSVWINYFGIATMVVLLVMFAWRPPALTALLATRPDRSLSAPREASQPATRLMVSLGSVLPLAGVGVTVLLLLLPGGAVLRQDPSLLLGIMAGAILLTLGAGELLLQKNYGRPGGAKTMPLQPVSPALLTVTIVALAAFVTVLTVTVWADGVTGAIWYGPERRWMVPTVTVGAVLALGVLPLLLITHRRDCGGNVPGLDAALRGISMYRLVRTIAAFLFGQAGVLVLTNTYAWRWLFGLGNPLAPADAYQSWGPAVVAGAVLCSAAVGLIVTPVRTFIPRNQPTPVTGPDPAQSTQSATGPSATATERQ